MYQSEFLDKVRSWIAYSSDLLGDAPEFVTEAGIETAVAQLGYGQPFDAEQKALNRILRDSCATETTCLTIWAFYHDYKSIKAGQKSRLGHRTGVRHGYGA